MAESLETMRNYGRAKAGQMYLARRGEMAGRVFRLVYSGDDIYRLEEVKPPELLPLHITATTDPATGIFRLINTSDLMLVGQC